MKGRTRAGDDVIWHDVECGGYGADLPLWEELAGDSSGPVLDLGCGTGRVGLHLARRGHRVVGLDRDDRLLGALDERAAGLPLLTAAGDAREFQLAERFGLVLATMQLIQLLADRDERRRCLRSVASHLALDGLVALAIVEEIPEATSGPPPLPDAREVDGWVYSSLPLDAVAGPGSILVRRLRQVLSPGGELSEELDEIRLNATSASALEEEAVEVGIHPVGRREIPATADHVGSTVVLLRGAR
jgi:SAM-dependent methyltransferase